MPGLVPTDPQQFAGPLGRLARPQRLNDEPLHEQREPAAFLRPGNRHLHHSMLRALDPRNPGVQMRLQLARVQVSPRPLRRMVVARQLSRTVRAIPPLPLRMLHVNVHAAPRQCSARPLARSTAAPAPQSAGTIPHRASARSPSASRSNPPLTHTKAGRTDFFCGSDDGNRNLPSRSGFRLLRGR